MKPVGVVVALVWLVCGSAPNAGRGAAWEIDGARSVAAFTIRYLGLHEVRGVFSHIAGSVERDEARADALRVTATIDAASVDTNNAERDADLRGPDYLDVARFPQMTFVSTGARELPDGGVAVAGDLTLHGVTRSVEFVMRTHAVASGAHGPTRIAAEGTASLSRREYGIGGNPLIGDHLTITLQLQLTPRP
jgi:polyisoprenoid-binding protein YceI